MTNPEYLAQRLGVLLLAALILVPGAIGAAENTA